MFSQTIIAAVEDLLACPQCQYPFVIEGDILVCTGCRREFQATAEGHLYMLDGLPQPDSALEMVETRHEERGMRYRLDNFYLPMLRRISRQTGRSPDEIRVLDNGCGIGESVAALRAAGFDAWGVDPGARHELWSGRDCRDYLLIADGCRLPFRDAAFDLVFSLGVIEHIGLEGDFSTSTKTAPDCHVLRRAFIEESMRILRPGGTFVLAHPNGAFPVDFWHGGWKGIRPHVPYEGFLPSIRDIRRYCREIDPSISVRSITPRQHLSFERVSAYWYGRTFRKGMSTLISLMEQRPFARLAASPLNPFLVSIISKPGKTSSFIQRKNFGRKN